MAEDRPGRHSGDMTKKQHTQGHGLDGLYDGLRRPGIMRASDEKWFAGVCTGVARWLGVDPLVVRAAFILFAIFFGMGVALYLVLWLLMPNEQGDISLERALKYGDGGSIFLLVITVISVLGGGPWFGDGDFRGARVGGVAVVAFLAWWFLTRTDSGRDLVKSSPWANRNAPAGAPGGASATTTDPTAGSAGSSPHGLSTGNAAAAAGAKSPRPPAPVPQKAQVRVRSFGFAATLTVLGAALAVGAVLASLAQNGNWGTNHLAIGVAAGLGVAGLATVIGGILGRRAGVLVPLSVVAMAFVVVTSVTPAGVSRPWDVGDRNITVTTLSDTNAYQLGMGDFTLDLRGAEYAKTTARPDVITASLGVGQLDIFIPTGTSVKVNTKGRAGDVRIANSIEAAKNDDSDGRAGADRESGVNFSRPFSFGTGDPELVINAEVGAGQIRIITGSTS